MFVSTTTLHDVLFGVYNWILVHPTETVLVLMFQQLQNSVDNRKFEEIIFDTLNNGLAKRFWLQWAGQVLNTAHHMQGLMDCWNKLGTLGAVHGKLILLHRFNYQFRSSPSNPFGVHLDAEQWAPNGRDIKLWGPATGAHQMSLCACLATRLCLSNRRQIHFKHNSSGHKCLEIILKKPNWSMYAIE